VEYLDDDDDAAASPGHRRARIIVALSLVFVAIVAVVGLLVVRHYRHRLDRQAADAKLCTNAAITLELAQPNMPFGVPTVEFRTTRTTAGRVAAELKRAGGDPHPWDEEPGGTTVVRCQSGRLLWIADARGHAARVAKP
jgi:hypothetical protein